jgi:WD40 repeat protein
VNDSKHFLSEHFDTIHNSPSQMYHSALLISPSSSWICKFYATELSQEVRVVKGLPAKWEMSFRTVSLGSGALALACGSNIIAVGSESNDITILNGITGTQVAVFSGHTGWVRALAFSSDGISLVSGSLDMALKLWDVQTGGVVKTFYGHTNIVYSVSISADCTVIASGSEDATIRVWDIQMGECRCVMGRQGQVKHVALSPKDPQHLISVSGSHVQKWHVSGYQIGPTYQGFHAAFSSDGTHFIYCIGNTVTIRNSDSGEVVATCLTPNNKSNLSKSCFSPNGGLVVAAEWNTIYIWDITGSDPLLITTFPVHANGIGSLAFSSPSTLIATCYDKSVKFWQIDGQSAHPVAGDPKPTPPISVPMKSISLQAEKGITISSDSSGMVRVWDISTGLCKVSFQTPATTYPIWRDAQMIDGRLIFVWLEDRGIYIWDTDEGRLLQMLGVKWSSCGGLRISGDGSKVFCRIDDHLQAWSIWTGEAVGDVEVKNNSQLDPLRVGSSRIWVYFEDTPAQGWDFGISGSSPIPLSSTPPQRPHLHFIHSIRWSGNSQSRIEDTATGKEVFWLSGRYTKPVDVQWDGLYLVACYRSGEVLILDFNHLS